MVQAAIVVHTKGSYLLCLRWRSEYQFHASIQTIDAIYCN